MRGRYVDNLLRGNVNMALWPAPTNTPGTGTGTVTVAGDGLSVTCTCTGAGTWRGFAGVSVAGLDTSKVYCIGAKLSGVIGSFTNETIGIAEAVAAGAGEIVANANGRWGVTLQPAASTITLRLGVGVDGNETCALGDSLTLSEPYVYEVEHLTDAPPEWVGANPVILNYAKTTSIAAGVVTAGTPVPYTENKADVVLVIGDSLGNDSADYPIRIRDSYHREMHVLATAGARISDFIAAVATWVASPTLYAPAQLSPGVCVVGTAINDVTADASAATMEAQLAQLETAIRAAGMVPVILTTPPFKTSTSWTAARQVVADDYNAHVRALATAYSVDIYTTLEDPNNPDVYLVGYDSGDHLHPSSTGGADGMAAVAGAIETLLDAVDTAGDVYTSLPDLALDAQMRADVTGLFLAGRDFDQRVKVGGVPLNAIVIEDFESTDPRAPQLFVRDDVLTSLAHGTPAIVDGKTYAVVGYQPDGAGGAILQLQP